MSLDGPKRFQRAIDHMPVLLDRLKTAPKVSRADHPIIPKEAGLYLFSEQDTPIYVGQTRNLHKRYEQHTSTMSRHNQASFAFLVAKVAAKQAGIVIAMKRATLETHEHFVPHFTKAKVRVAKMAFQFILSADPIERSLFEIYAALHLGTEQYNSFETH